MLATDPVSILKFTVSASMDMFLCQTMLVLIGANPILDLSITEKGFSWHRFYSVHCKQDFFSLPNSLTCHTPTNQLSPIIVQLQTREGKGCPPKHVKPANCIIFKLSLRLYHRVAKRLKESALQKQICPLLHT